MENKFSKIFEKKQRWVVILLIGILLVVVAMPSKTESESKQMSYYDSKNNTNTEIELRLKQLLENMQNVGEVEVMITYEDRDTVEGVVVLADGAGNAVVVRNISEIVQALFDVDSHKIKVIERNYQIKK